MRVWQEETFCWGSGHRSSLTFEPPPPHCASLSACRFRRLLPVCQEVTSCAAAATPSHPSGRGCLSVCPPSKRWALLVSCTSAWRRSQHGESQKVCPISAAGSARTSNGSGDGKRWSERRKICPRHLPVSLGAHGVTFTRLETRLSSAACSPLFPPSPASNSKSPRTSLSTEWTVHTSNQP